MTPSGRSPSRKRAIQNRYAPKCDVRARYARLTMMSEVDPDQVYWNPRDKKGRHDFSNCVRKLHADSDVVHEVKPQNKVSFDGLATPVASLVVHRTPWSPRANMSPGLG